MSEPMCRLGAEVTGIDASSKNIKIAELHSKQNDLKINYINTSPERMKEKEKYDVILNLEIVEHVENVDLYFWHVSFCYFTLILIIDTNDEYY